jgi:hypothetical protein
MVLKDEARLLQSTVKPLGWAEACNRIFHKAEEAILQLTANIRHRPGGSLV